MKIFQEKYPSITGAIVYESIVSLGYNLVRLSERNYPVSKNNRSSIEVAGVRTSKLVHSWSFNLELGLIIQGSIRRFRTLKFC